MTRLTITTSWDDGYPLDLRLAEMLAQRGIRATFYVPRICDRAVIRPAEMRRLSTDFEIGAHTLSHCDLTRVDFETAREEIAKSKEWVEQITGKPCQTFCFPGGRFRAEHLDCVWEAGYRGCRTVELFSVKLPSKPPVLATSVQAFPHSLAAYGRNLLKRWRIARLLRLITFPRDLPRNWVALSSRLLTEAARSGGVFHLWGHSWEFADENHWKALSTAFDRIQAYRDLARYATNSEVCAGDLV